MDFTSNRLKKCHRIILVNTISRSIVNISIFYIQNGTITFERTIEPQHFVYQDDIIDVKAHSFEDKDGLPTSATPYVIIMIFS